MSTVKRLVALIAVILATLGPAHAQSGDLEYLGTQQLSPRLRELTFRTSAVATDTKVRVLTPEGYDPSASARYPVLYLLNGANGDQTSWTINGDAEKITAGYPLIIVMPDGGKYGGYTDWYNGGAGGPPMWETYHIGQLLPWIDANFATTGTREGRAVAGLSMGGGGAMAYAARHPDLFGAAGSFSGAVDTNSIYVQPLTETSGIGDGVMPGSVFGPRVTDEVRWRGRNPWDLAENLAGIFLQVDTGNGMPGGPGGDTGDPVEAGVHEESLSFHNRLSSLGIPHVWNDYGAGGHAWYYWQRDLTQFLPRLMNVFANPQPAPAEFDYTSVQPDYSVYGWHVAVTRPALEFSELRGANPGGFVLRGSGTAEVTTAAYYPPGSTLDVAVRNAEGTTHTSMPADGHGRLSLTLTLGPGNPYQEYSPQARVWMATTGPTTDTGRALDEAQSWPVYAATVSVTPET